MWLMQALQLSRVGTSILYVSGDGGLKVSHVYTCTSSASAATNAVFTVLVTIDQVSGCVLDDLRFDNHSLSTFSCQPRMDAFTAYMLFTGLARYISAIYIGYISDIFKKVQKYMIFSIFSKLGIFHIFSTLLYYLM